MRSFIFISIPRCLQLGINTGILQALGTIIGKDVRSHVELARQELEALQEEGRMTPDLVFREHQLLDFLGVRGHLQREGPGGGHPPGAGEVPAGALALTSY